MIDGYTIFISYLLAPTTGTTYSGFSQAIHCNYINSLVINTVTPEIYEVNFRFSSAQDFKFLSNFSNGTGFTAYKIYALVQEVSGITSDITPIANNWKIVDFTPQITGHVLGVPLTAAELAGRNFKIYLSGYTGYTTYALNYLNYPTSGSTDDSKLCFGDEIYFFGNVTTDIHADVYTTDISIVLPQNQFNSSTNPTWIQASQPPVAISEIGIYDSNHNLVAIGKLNDPITKDSTISRTIAFELDF
jgi:hypothetical protein